MNEIEQARALLREVRDLIATAEIDTEEQYDSLARAAEDVTRALGLSPVMG